VLGLTRAHHVLLLLLLPLPLPLPLPLLLLPMLPALYVDLARGPVMLLLPSAVLQQPRQQQMPHHAGSMWRLVLCLCLCTAITQCTMGAG
jgi:hypothetical protein